VMTFPGDLSDGVAGDIAICPAWAARQAPQFGTAFADELLLYAVHGWLHLAGLTDTHARGRAAMRAAEQAAIAHLAAHDLLPPAFWRAARS
jgi:probable rRNA maturation factor